MSTLKHTDFMPQIAKTVGQYLTAPYENPHFGETRWLCQLYYGDERRIHYEVARVANRQGKCLEIGLHLESRNSAHNRAQIIALDQHLIELRVLLECDVRAEMWDKGWTKLYELHPDEDLTPKLVQKTAQRLARFIHAVQPIYETLA